MRYNPLPLTKLIEQFASLPGIGMKTAQRLAYHVLTLTREETQAFCQALLDAHEQIHNCSVCKNFTDKEVCEICGDSGRDRTTICVVENPKDVSAFEKTRGYEGLYHVLHGLISPMDGIGPDQIYIKDLMSRLAGNEVKEVILATSPTVEGEATAIYLSKLIKPLGVTASRIAYGMPVGSELEYADEITLSKALENRNEL